MGHIPIKRLIKRLIIAALLLAPGLGWGQSLAEQERRFELLRSHHARLEQQLGEQGQRIRRLKGQPAGVGRDYQLGAALRQSQQLADRLTQLREQLRQEHAALLRGYQGAIAAAADEAQRAALRRRRAARALPREPSHTRIVTADAASPNDSPEDLEEKADLLKDSEEKVRAQLRRMSERLGRLEHQARLQRHASAADDSPFVETAPRRTSRTYTTRESAPGAAANATPTAGGGGGSAPAGGATGIAPASKSNSADPSATPPPAPPSAEADDATRGADFSAATPSPAGGGTWSCSGASCAEPGITLSVTTRDALDPSLLDKLGQAGSSGDVRERIAALKRAAGQLGQLAGTLSARAKALRQRAGQMRQRK